MVEIRELDGKRYEVRNGKYYLLVMNPVGTKYYMDDGHGVMKEVTEAQWKTNQAKRASKTNKSAARAIDYDEIPEKVPTVFSSEQ